MIMHRLTTKLPSKEYKYLVEGRTKLGSYFLAKEGISESENSHSQWNQLDLCLLEKLGCW